jgi:UDP-2-acetamido-2,6-beta-L-arabino-hexul-4-ose reductase
MEGGSMKKVLLTGADGFIGRNVRARLGQRNDIELFCFDIENTKEQLAEMALAADFVIHLAGVNRPQHPSEFETGNRGLTEELVECLTAGTKKAPLLVSSSIQAELDNPYGKSKRGAEEAVRSYSAKTGAKTFLFRLPNVFGKWCRPNYNSVVATWCHNTANGLPIRIDEPEKTLRLVYIDDVAEAFISALDGGMEPEPDGFFRVRMVYERSLRQISDLLESFAASRASLVMPSLEDDFARRLYGTWLSYLPEDGFGYPLEMKRDNRGWLAEFIKSQTFGQIFISKTKPGITRGNHWHHTKVEKFLVISGSGLIKFRKIDGSDVIKYHVSGDELRVVDIPVGYTHSITNIGNEELVTLFWADELFDSAHPDTYFQEV